MLRPRILWCDYDVAVASQIVILIVWVQLPLVTPKNFYAKVAHQVEHQFEALGVVGSSPTLGTILFFRSSMVEQSADNR